MNVGMVGAGAARVWLVCLTMLFGQTGAAVAQGGMGGTGASKAAEGAAVTPRPAAGSIASHPGWPEPREADVRTVAGIVAALYDVISGPAGQARDWNRMRSLFVPEAKLIPVRVLPGSPDSKRPGADVVYFSLDGYIARSGPVMLAQGFFERRVHDEVAEFGNMVHVFSTYESRHGAGDAAPFARGINSIQLLRDGERYWIVNVMWDSERAGTGIPARYLPGGAGAASPGGPGLGAAGALMSNFQGDWVGTLEYRDFSSNQQVFLPTWLTMTPAAGGGAVQLAYTYDDGPNKTVREVATLTFDAAGAATDRATLTSGQETQRYAVQGLTEFAKTGRGVLTLTGTGTENKEPVDVRIVLTLRRNLYTWRKETRRKGEQFKFRDGYTFTRAAAPGVG